MNIIRGNNYFLFMKVLLAALGVYGLVVGDKIAIFGCVAILMSFFFMEKQFRIKGIVIDGDNIKISKLSGDIEFKKSDVKSVEKFRSVITIDAGENKEVSILMKFIKRADREKLEDLTTELEEMV